MRLQVRAAPSPDDATWTCRVRWVMAKGGPVLLVAVGTAARVSPMLDRGRLHISHRTTGSEGWPLAAS